MSKTDNHSLDVLRQLEVGGKSYRYYSLKGLEGKGLGDIDRIPFSIKVLLENLLRFEDGQRVTSEDIKSICAWSKNKKVDREIAFRPARVLMQDFTGVPAVVDLAAMRDAVKKLKGDPRRINPLVPVDLVIDHSVMVDEYASANAFEANVDREYERNQERYAFLSWGQKSFDNFRVVPPGTGICHQVNLEYLGQVVWSEANYADGDLIYPDTVVGTDSHTTMINALAVLGWGVGGIEAEAAMLGQPISMLVPEVVGFKLTGAMKEGTTATDLVLQVTQMLRKKGVVGKFVEFYGEGLDALSLADRATVANMAPEYGATCGFFPIDKETINYLRFTARDEHVVNIVEAYAKEQGMWRDEKTPDPIFTDTISLDISTVESSMAGPRLPQDNIALSNIASSFSAELEKMSDNKSSKGRQHPVEGENYSLEDGHVMIAAITSCTNTSNPSVMLGAGLLARNALKRGLQVKPWVKTSLAPGSKVVTDYLEKADLQKDLDELGFNLVGYGCTTCIGNSGPLDDKFAKVIDSESMYVASVLSGNRNFEGRINPHTKASYLASPILVVAYALAGSVRVDLLKDPIGIDPKGQDVYLKDIWPSNKEIAEYVRTCVTQEMFKKRYSEVFKGDAHWQRVSAESSDLTYNWDQMSSYVQHPPYFEGMSKTPSVTKDIIDAKPLAILGDMITTDHISPAGSIKGDSPAGKYLQALGVKSKDFNSYGSRRGNHEIMMRGTFANIRLQNEMTPDKQGSSTKHMPEGTETSIYDAAMLYKAEGTPLVVVAGMNYGQGSSRDWAAKGTRLLGVRAVISEGYERIHRSNLIGMGVIPLEFTGSDNRKSLDIDAHTSFTIKGLADLKPRQKIACEMTFKDGSKKEVMLQVRIDTADELTYFQNDGILHYVLRTMTGSHQTKAVV